MQIRNEQPGDEAAIHLVNVASFPTDAEARLVDALRVEGDLAVSLVAQVNGEVVGHVAFSPVTVTDQSDTQRGVGLAPVAVVESHRKQGIAYALINTGIDACRAAGFTWMAVLGDPAYYQRFGFRTASDFGLHDAYGGGEAFQVLALNADESAVPCNAGLVQYATAFGMFE